jgi:AcrR family transcriptional regulator
MKHNAEATKAVILRTATKEFSSYGFAGARVDRIAQASKFNKQLIYAYYENKEGLFVAVAQAHIQDVLDTVPLDAYDLPEYAASLYDYNSKHPELVRLVQWIELEGLPSDEVAQIVMESMIYKVAAIKVAQVKGFVSSRLGAEELLSIVLAVSGAWAGDLHRTTTGESVEQEASHRQAVIDVIASLTQVYFSTSTSD